LDEGADPLQVWGGRDGTEKVTLLGKGKILRKGRLIRGIFLKKKKTTPQPIVSIERGEKIPRSQGGVGSWIQ